MVRPTPQRVLLIGDTQRQVYGAIAQAMPTAAITSVGSVFEGICELNGGTFNAVFAAAEPIERRPEAAVRTLRELAGEGRVILFGHPTLELLSRKMLQFGSDDYIVTPVGAAEVQQVFGAPPMRLATGRESTPMVDEAPPRISEVAAALARLPLAEILLEAMLQHPHDAMTAAVEAMNAHLPQGIACLLLTKPKEAAPVPPTDGGLSSQPLHHHNDELGALHLRTSSAEEDAAARHALAQVAAAIAKVGALQDRHNLMQRLAITDDLTGLSNARYFRHFLSRIIERGRARRFTVTLLLFDIDNFKKYNDEFGHPVGDEILRQTATLMRRCCRDHDLVARIGGDEFAAVFWEKEGPRQPREPKPVTPSRAPQTPLEIFKRFRRMMSGVDFPELGEHGKGKLGISAGMAVFPYDATDAAGLIKAADEALMFGAKQGGKDSIYLVGGEG